MAKVQVTKVSSKKPSGNQNKTGDSNVTVNINMTDEGKNQNNKSETSESTSSKAGGSQTEDNEKKSGGAGKLVELAKSAASAIGSAALSAGTEILKLGSEFETAMAKVSTKFGEVNVNSDALKERLLALSDTTGVAASELGTGLYQALSSGVPVTEDMGSALGVLESSARLSKAGFTDIESALGATTAVLNSYKLGVGETDNVQKMLLQTQNSGAITIKELSDSLGDILPTASSANVGFDQISAALATMTASMGEGSAPEAVSGLKSLLTELSDSGSKTSASLEAATTAAFGTSKTFSDLQQAGYSISDVMQLLSDYSDKSGISMNNLVGSQEAVQAALSLSGDNAQTFYESLASINSETDVVGEAFDKISGTSGEQFNSLLNDLKNIAISLFLQMAPLIESLIPYIAWVVDKLLPVIMQLTQDLMPPMKEMIGAIKLSILSMTEALLPVLVDILEELGPVFAEIIEKLLPPLVNIIGALLPLIEPILSLLTPILDMITSLLDPLVTLMNEALTPLIELLVQVINVAIVPAQNAMKAMCAVYEEVFRGIISTATEHIKRLTDIFQNIIDFIKNVFTGNWKGAWENVKSIFTGIADGIGAAFKLPLNFIIDCINGFIEGLSRIEIPDWVPLVGGARFSIPTIPRLKVGMDYVPSDYFPAFLDKGEAVLTTPEASVYRSFGGIDGIERVLSTIGGSMGSFSVNMYGDWNVREEADIDKVSQAIYAKVQSEKRGRGIL